MSEFNQQSINNYEKILDKFNDQNEKINANTISINKIEIGLDYLRDKLDDSTIGEIIDSKLKQYFNNGDMVDLREDIMEEITDSIQEQADEIIKTIQEESPSRGTFIDSIKRETKKLIIEEREIMKRRTDKIISKERQKIVDSYEMIKNEVDKGLMVSNGLYYMVVVNIILIIITLIILAMLYSM
jgi:hypothetical protein